MDGHICRRGLGLPYHSALRQEESDEKSREPCMGLEGGQTSRLGLLAQGQEEKRTESVFSWLEDTVTLFRSQTLRARNMSSQTIILNPSAPLMEDMAVSGSGPAMQGTALSCFLSCWHHVKRQPSPPLCLHVPTMHDNE